MVIASVSWTLASNVENLTLAGNAAINATGNTLAKVLVGNSAINTVTGNAGNDTLDGGAGADSLIGGTGNDTYKMGSGYSVDTVAENDATAGNTDVALFGAGIADDQLWFRKVSNNLEGSIIGTADKLVLQNLEQAMAAFATPAAGQTTLSAAFQASLSPVIAANWN